MSSSNVTGRRFGSYELRRQIGLGGMGSVYEAYQPSVQRTVAIKLLPESLSRHTTRFEREVRVMAQLEHPHILPVYDFGTEDGVSFIVMRLLTGGSLLDRLREFGLPNPKETVRILEQVASALDFAHQRGVIHRDIKPSNIIFDDQGNAYLSDFGLAKLFESQAVEITATGQVIGTPAYMAPELWRGESANYFADIYAPGIVAYEMFTGNQPFSAETPFAFLMQHINEMPKPISTANAAVPVAANRVIEKALAKSQEERYATASTFVDDLKAAFGGAAVDAAPSKFATGSAPAVRVDDTPLPASQPFMQPQTAPYIQLQRAFPDTPPARRVSILPIVGVVAVVLVLGIGLLLLLWNLASLGSSGGGSSILVPVALLTLVVLFIGGIAWRFAAVPRPIRQQRQMSSTPTKVEGRASPKPALYDLAAGMTFEDHYKLVKRLDSGDTSFVFQAFDEDTERDVAIKVINSGTEHNSEQALRFKREAKILGSLSHAHIVPFYEYKTREKISYIAMPLLTGGTLKEALVNSGFSDESILRFLSQIASALDYLHSRDIIHRDLKTSNIMFNEARSPYIVDFGLAKPLNSQTQLTQLDALIGTPSYMAPEQVINDKTTPATDQYTLAVIAYQMLTGKLPFDAPNHYALMRRHVYDEVPLPSKTHARLAPADKVILKALAKKPESRFATVSEFAKALEVALLGKSADVASSDESKKHVFVSYSRENQGYARSLVKALEDNAFAVWIDDRIETGDSWWYIIEKAIEECAAFAVVMTPDARGSEWVRREVMYAVNLKKPLFPLLLEGDNWAIFSTTQYEDVSNNLPPRNDFYRRLGKILKTDS